MAEVLPNIEIPDIKIEFDKQFENKETQSLVDGAGVLAPIVSINGIVCHLGAVISLSYSVRMNKLFSFSLNVQDYFFKIRNSLKKEKVDKIIIFSGWKQGIYLKFEGVITNISESPASNVFRINGVLNTPDLYSSEQKSYKEQTIDEILTDIATTSNVGYFPYDNENLSTTLFRKLNTGLSKVEFFDDVIKKHSVDNIWIQDPFYFFHVGNITTLRSKTEPDKYTCRGDGELIEEAPLIITNEVLPRTFVDEAELAEWNNKIYFQALTVNNNSGEVEPYSFNNFTINDKVLKINQNKSLGLKDNNTNTFSEYTDRYLPDYEKIVSKELLGKYYTVNIGDPIWEITPFGIVEFVLFNSQTSESPQIFDEENSGLRIVIGYDILYNSKKNSLNKSNYNQTLICI